MARYSRFSVIPLDHGSCIYAAELKNGVVKVGCSQNPRIRLPLLNAAVRREYRTSVLRWHLSNAIDCHNIRVTEALVLSRMARIGSTLNGRAEFFTGVPFSVAVNLVNQLTENA